MSSQTPLTDVAGFLVGAGLSLTLGMNFFVSLLPDSPDLVTVLTEYPGAEPDFVFSTTLPAFEETRFQVITRDVEANYGANEARIWAVYHAILPVVNVTISGTQYERFEPLHAPSFMHRDEKRRIHHVLNFYTLRSPV